MLIKRNIFIFLLTLIHIHQQVKAANISVSLVIQKSITHAGPSYMGVNMVNSICLLF